MRAPVALAELVGDQAVGGIRVGHAQERLGEAQQGDAFLRVKPVFLQELVYPTARLRVAQFRQHGLSPPFDPGARITVQRCALQKRLQHLRLRGAKQAADFGARGCRSVRHGCYSKGLSVAAARPYAEGR